MRFMIRRTSFNTIMDDKHVPYKEKYGKTCELLEPDLFEKEMEFTSFEELIIFMNKVDCDEVVISKREDINVIELYDDYRE